MRGINLKKTCIISLIALLLGMVLVTGCNGKEDLTVAKDGNTVKAHYTGKLDDGTVFDTSLESEPLEFVLGSGQLIPGFDEAVRGMKVGQTKTVRIPAEEAYGPHLEDMVIVIERDKLPANLNPTVGQRLQMQHENGSVVAVMVTDVSDTTITLDGNHPLAGKALTFEIQVVEIR